MQQDHFVFQTGYQRKRLISDLKELCMLISLHSHVSLVLSMCALVPHAYAAKRASKDGLHHFTAGQHFELRHEHGNAEREFREAIKSDPDYLPAHIAYLDVYKSARFERAERK